jgi:glutaredoxin
MADRRTVGGFAFGLVVSCALGFVAAHHAAAAGVGLTALVAAGGGLLLVAVRRHHLLVRDLHELTDPGELDGTHVRLGELGDAAFVASTSAAIWARVETAGAASARRTHRSRCPSEPAPFHNKLQGHRLRDPGERAANPLRLSLQETEMTDHPPVTIYSTPTCPDCRALKSWLSDQGIAFEEKDLSDPRIMAEAKERTGVRVAPITIVGDAVFYGTFASQKPVVAEALGLRSTWR